MYSIYYMIMSALPEWLHQWNLSTSSQEFVKNIGSLLSRYWCKLHPLSYMITDGAEDKNKYHFTLLSIME